MTEAEAKEKLKQLAAEALAVQDAVNASGVIHAMSRAVTDLWHVCRALKKPGTDWVNTHPVLRLFVSKLIHLAQFENGCLEYSAAHDHCEALARGEDPGEHKYTPLR